MKSADLPPQKISIGDQLKIPFVKLFWNAWQVISVRGKWFGYVVHPEISRYRFFSADLPFLRYPNQSPGTQINRQVPKSIATCLMTSTSKLLCEPKTPWPRLHMLDARCIFCSWIPHPMSKNHSIGMFNMLPNLTPTWIFNCCHPAPPKKAEVIIQMIQCSKGINLDWSHETKSKCH